jgi:hypothetical protein
MLHHARQHALAHDTQADDANLDFVVHGGKLIRLPSSVKEGGRNKTQRQKRAHNMAVVPK